MVEIGRFWTPECSGFGRYWEYRWGAVDVSCGGSDIVRCQDFLVEHCLGRKEFVWKQGYVETSQPSLWSLKLYRSNPLQWRIVSLSVPSDFKSKSFFTDHLSRHKRFTSNCLNFWDSSSSSSFSLYSESYSFSHSGCINVPHVKITVQSLKISSQVVL